ncbi:MULTISPECIES: hypothetical protein [unclassified Gordonia (in: high G+C Gram-positive bacteria)]|nr:MULTISPECIES: hypothetical protein [unclassified Gordonia (in: high G+C Gram-positive bacteria)]MDF3283943.1 hypothetical protein [Gordonia sp. N1V]OPX16715.1 hypothetical protein B1964_03385 [Gordonia sp. i37]
MHRESAIRNTVAVAAAAAIIAGAGMASADPNIQTPGVDDGVPNCAVLNARAAAGYIGTGAPQPSRPMDENFAHPPRDWCNTDVGYSRLSFGPKGATFSVPPTVQGLFPYNNAELLAKPVFEPGQTMAMRVTGTQQIPTWNGTTGWGISNRSIDPLGLEVAWFMWNGSAGFMGQASQLLTTPLFHAFAQDMPRGFFMMVKKAGTLLPQIVLLDPKLLANPHDYSIKLDKEYVNFFVDGHNVGTFRDAPIGTWHDISGGPVPLLGQMWLDSSYWFPLPIPEFNGRWQSVDLARYRQGPSATTPLTF